MSRQIIINDKDISSNVAMPLKWNALLDERLDEGRMSVRHVTTKLYPLGAQVKITVDDTVEDFIISADESTEIPVGSGYYNHELSLIEPTKLLEGIVVESLTFTNNLGRTYDINKIDVEPQITPSPQGSLTLTAKTFMQAPVKVGDTITVPSTTGLDRIYATNGYAWPTTSAKNDVKVLDPSGDVIYSASGTYEPKTILIDKIGQYRIVYTYGLQAFSTSSGKNNYDIEYSFLSIDLGKRPLQKWNIKTVIDRVLNLSEPHLQSVSPRFHLDESQAAEFEKLLAPEFAFTKCTLKEILDQIGGFIHGIPRLIRGESGEFDTIRYDMLNRTDEALISLQKTRYITEILSHNIEEYVTELDSTADNLVNTLDSNEGAITEPYAGGFKSVRSEEAYARIEEGNMIISTSLPIYSIQKLEVIDPENNIGDITAYVFEGAEYGRLSSFEGSYPSSKAYAIYYNLGEKNIKGLSYKSPNVIGGAFAEYSITNIIKVVTGYNISTDWWSSKDTVNYTKLAFRVTYTPIFSARILQHKPYIEYGALARALVYNQGANLIETRYYGENMRGAVARMGNPELVRTYRMSNLTYVPKIGQIFKRDGDDYFISFVTVAVYAKSVDFTVGMSKDFNRLSQYIGINSEWRAYEVSERKAYNRDMIYRDYCVIGNPMIKDAATILTIDGMKYIANIFSHSISDNYGEYYSKPITLAKVTTYDSQNNDYTVTLPVVSTAFGNAIVFSFGMADNYSAGAQSIPQDPNSAITGYWQTDVPYVDYYGRIKSMEFELGSIGNDIKFADESAFALPQGNQYKSENPVPIRTPADNKLEIDKNGSEILRMNYQIEFVSNRSDIIIGSALARNCLMVTTRQTQSKENNDAVHAAAVYVTNDKVGRFDTTIDLSSATLVYDYRNNVPSVTSLKFITLGVVNSTVSGKAWVIADQSSGEILLAQNMDISVGDEISLPYISLRHKLP